MGERKLPPIKDAIERIDDVVLKAGVEAFELDWCAVRFCLKEAADKIEELEAAALRSAAEHPIVQTLQDALDGCNKNNAEFAKQHREDKKKTEELEAQVKRIEVLIPLYIKIGNQSHQYRYYLDVANELQAALKGEGDG